MKAKKLTSTLLAAGIVFGSFAFSAERAAADGFTNIYEDYENDIDGTGEWKYRELVPDVECETVDNFKNYNSTTAGSTSQTDVYLSTDAKNGAYCLERYARTDAGIGFSVPKMLSGDEYIVSAWLKGECNGTSPTKISPAAGSGLIKKTSGGWAQHNNTGAWTYYSEKITVSAQVSADTETFGFANVTGKVGFIDNTDKYVQKIQIDDFSLRRALPEDFMETEMLPGVFDEENMTVTYRFNMDIDPRTVRKENIEVGGKRNSEYIEDVFLETTDEQTREHRLTLQLKNISAGNIYVVNLPDLRDAWGRSVAGNEALIIGTYPEGQYTIFNDLDSVGKWKYRELIPDVECENLSYFAEKNQVTKSGSITDVPDANRRVTLSDDAHYGKNCITDILTGWRGFGTQIDNLEAGAIYRFSYWAKADMAEGLSSVSFNPAYATWGIPNDKHEESNFPAGSNITSEWGYYEYRSKVPMNNITAFNYNNNFCLFFNANNKVDGVSVPNKIYLDDWSVRMALPEDFMDTEITEAFYNSSASEVKFVFNLDIDPRTVRRENIKINGAVNESLISDITLTTDEYTRVTALTVGLANLKDGMDYTVELADIKDAWGREISGDKTVSFKTPPAVRAEAVFKKGASKVQKLTDGEISIDMTLENNTDKTINAIVAAARCKNGVFKGIVSRTVKLSAGFNTLSDLLEPENMLSLLVDPDDDAVRVFVWKSENGMLTPAAAYAELTADGCTANGY